MKNKDEGEQDRNKKKKNPTEDDDPIMKRKFVENILIVVGIFIAIALVLAGVNFLSSESTSDTPSLGQGKAAPDFKATDVVSGATIELSDYKGTFVLLNFVNLGCGADIDTVVSAFLMDLKELREDGYDFLPISVFCGCCSPETLKNFAVSNGLNWPWILDTGNTISQQYADYYAGYPTLIFIDEDGYIRDSSGSLEKSALGQKITGY